MKNYFRLFLIVVICLGFNNTNVFGLSSAFFCMHANTMSKELAALKLSNGNGALQTLLDMYQSELPVYKTDGIQTAFCNFIKHVLLGSDLSYDAQILLSKWGQLNIDPILNDSIHQIKTLIELIFKTQGLASEMRTPLSFYSLSSGQKQDFVCDVFPFIVAIILFSEILQKTKLFLYDENMLLFKDPETGIQWYKINETIILENIFFTIFEKIRPLPLKGELKSKTFFKLRSISEVIERCFGESFGKEGN